MPPSAKQRFAHSQSSCTNILVPTSVKQRSGGRVPESNESPRSLIQNSGGYAKAKKCPRVVMFVTPTAYFLLDPHSSKSIPSANEPPGTRCGGFQSARV